MVTPTTSTRWGRARWPANSFIEPTNRATNASGGAPVDGGGGAELLDTALRHDTDAVTDGERFLLVVGDEQGGDARPRSGCGGSRRASVVRTFASSARQRLVEQQHLRLDGERPGERDTLLLAARELVLRSGSPCWSAARAPSSRTPDACVARRAACGSCSPNSTFWATVRFGNRL